MTIGNIIAVCAILLVLFGGVIAWEPINLLLASKLKMSNYELLLKISGIAVGWAEQWLKTKKGVEKKSEVINWVCLLCQKYGLDFSDLEIDKAIEDAVLKMNKEKNQNEQ